MRTIYLDSEFKCHVANADNMTAVETSVFDGKCDAYVEGYRFVPEGESWTREDGVVFSGEMVSPWAGYDQLAAAQRQYEQEQLADMENALKILLGGDAV